MGPEARRGRPGKHLEVLIAPDRKTAAQRTIRDLRSIEDKLAQLPLQIIHNDANDTNLLIKGDSISGLIDFGDMIRSARICNLSVATAYACMKQPDPVSAAKSIASGYHRIQPLTPVEIELMPALIAGRLAVSGTIAATRGASGNPYHQSTADQVWDALLKLHGQHPYWIELNLRQAGSLADDGPETALHHWLYASDRTQPSPILGAEVLGAVELDLRPGSQIFEGPAAQLQQNLDKRMSDAGAVIGIGRYAETRPIYTEPMFEVETNLGPARRDVHMGLALFAPASTPVFAPLSGTIVGLANNPGSQDYGPTIILEHDLDGLKFYSLYGHLSQESLDKNSIGKIVRPGQWLASFGDEKINGGWPPHLHFQLIGHLLGNQHEFPGVVWRGELDAMRLLCPNPIPLITGLTLV